MVVETEKESNKISIENDRAIAHLDCIALGRLGDVKLLHSGEGVIALVLEGSVVVVKDGLWTDTGP